jgi:predicted aconitate hydratase
MCLSKTNLSEGRNIMGKTLTQKILEKHLAVGEYITGKEIGIRIDQTLTQDATGTMAYLQFEAMGLKQVKTELSVSYVDHNTVQVGFENADDHKYLQTVAAKYGIIYSKAGNGICHQVHLERFGKPGKTLLGSDSHTPTGGGIGMIAIGAGGLDVAVAMGGGEFYLNCPKVYKINLRGSLQPWVTAKDVVLKMLEIFTTKGNVDAVMEYAGPGVETLTVPERATIANMGAEMGVTTSVFPSDEETRKFLKAQGREADWVELKADDDAEYNRVLDIELSELEPLAAAPHSPGNVVSVSDLKNIKVDQVMVGSCTNSSYKEVATVAKIMKGRKVHPDVSFGIAPGSRQVLLMAARDGYLGDLLAAGARLQEAACGFCIGNSQSPKSRGVSLRTSNRNFEGRSGTADAQVYLVSPEVAAVSAIAGAFIDPRETGIEYPKVGMPSQFLIDDSMFIFPKDADRNVEIVRGPNIGTPPVNDKMPDNIVGHVGIKVGDKITTDHIMPAGARLKYRSNVPKYSEFVFEPIDPGFPKRAMADKQKGFATIVIAGESYGQGSSREHAALCPMYLGVKAIVAKSVERIHAANLVNFGIIALSFKNIADYDKIDQGDEIEIPDIKSRLQNNEAVILVDKTKNLKIELGYNLSQRQKDILYEGGLLSYTVRAGGS